MALVAIIEGEPTPVVLHPGPKTPDGRKVALTNTHLTIGNQTWPVVVARNRERVWVHLDGRAYEVTVQGVVDHLFQATASTAADEIRAPMPGVVVQTRVTAGQAVGPSDVIMIIESMKLETSIRAGRSGRIEKLHVVEGQSFDRDALLAVLEAEGE